MRGGEEEISGFTKISDIRYQRNKQDSILLKGA